MEVWYQTVTEDEFTMDMVPEAFADLVEAVGIRSFLAICRRFAGGAVTVPLDREVRVRPCSDHDLLPLIGEKAYRRYHQCLGSSTVYFPTLEKLFTPVRDLRMIQEYHQGMSYLQVAQRYGVSTMTVKTVMRRASRHHRHHATTNKPL